MEGWSTVVIAVLLVGAGLTPLVDTGATNGIQATSTETHHVHIVDFDMDPGSLTIEAGDTVEWHNHDGAAHTATDDGGSWDTGALSTGESEIITFDEVADYTYHCEFHPSSMTGFELHVVEPNEPPSVDITTPTEGAHLQGVVQIEGLASDADGTVEAVEVRVDGGEWRLADGTTEWSLAWDTATVVDGEHTIEARSFDGSEHSPIDVVNVTTDNPTPDLSVEAIETEQGLGQATVDVIVANIGETASPATSLEVTYQASRGEGQVGTVDLPALDVGQETILTLEWETLNKVGKFELVAAVDPDDVVTDPIASNDERVATVCIPDAGGATCAIDGTEVGSGLPSNRSLAEHVQ